MSLGYAERLKKGQWRGECGVEEKSENESSLLPKIEKLITLWRGSKHVVVHTGAGISTTCGIPDFRGQNGVWTREERGEAPPAGVDFAKAVPSFTHMALSALVEAGFVQYIVSQNVDGLHLRSGVPRDKLSELHGNLFIERCNECEVEYFGDVEITSVGFRPTGTPCPQCDAPLVDQCLDWNDALPEYDLRRAEQHSKQATLSICMGTSLQMQPAMDLPVMATYKYRKPARGKMVICNLSETRMDKHAALILRAYTDDVLRLVCEGLGVQVPTYTTYEGPRTFHCPVPNSNKRKRKSSRRPRPRGVIPDTGPCKKIGCNFYGTRANNFLCSMHLSLHLAVNPTPGSGSSDDEATGASEEERETETETRSTQKKRRKLEES